MATATCAACGKRFEAQRKTARFCGPTCRQRSHRRPDSPAAAPVAPVAPLPDSSGPPSLVEATRKELEDAGRLDTALGAQALHLAERLSMPDTGSAVAALSKELRAVMAEALKDAAKAADSLDELAARRARKVSGA